jgi:hypothetical protein
MAQQGLLKKVNARIKTYTRGGMSFKAARKKAWDEYRSGKISGTRKKAAVKKSPGKTKPAKVISRTTVKRKTTVKVAGMSGVGMAGFKHCVSEIGRMDKMIIDFGHKKKAAVGSLKSFWQKEINKAKQLKSALTKQKQAYKSSI